MVGSMGSLTENYVQCLVGVTLIALVIMLLRKFISKKVSKRFVYGMWIMLPLFMLMVPFVKLPMPQFVSEALTNDISVVETTNMATANTTSEIKTPEGSTDFIQMEETVILTASPKTQESELTVPAQQVDTPLKKIDMVAIIRNGYLAIVLLFFAVILFVNYRFGKQCIYRREYMYTSQGIGLPVYRLRGISSPFIMGRCIYMPDDMGDEELRYAIIHEESHFKHGDPLWVLVRYIILGIYFYNPIIWLAFKYSGYDCELACDEEVMRSIHETEHKKYGGLLLNAINTHKRVSDSIILSTNMKSGKKLIRQRIENIAYRNKRSFLAMLLAIVMLFSVVGLALMDDTPVQAKEIRTMQEEQNTAESDMTQAQPALNKQIKSNTVSYGDTVQLCLEIWLRPVGETEETYTIIENGRELALVVDDSVTSFEEYGTICEEDTFKNLLKDIQGKQKGDVVTEIEVHHEMEYHYIFTVLGINDAHHPSYQLPEDWDYQLDVAYTKNFYTEGENNKESDTGKMYGFLEKFKDWSGHYTIGSRIFYTNAEASSTLAPQGRFAYTADNATICARFCTWCEGAQGDGIGEYIELRQLFYGPGEEVLTFNELCIVNGYAENEKKWRENNRVKSLKLYYEDVYMGTITLEDTIKPQYIDITPLNLTVGNAREATFRFEIAEVYEGTKYEDTCITGIEIGFLGKETVE